VFFSDKYATLQNSTNDLYYSLINAVDESQGKSIILLGCQFNEAIQQQKFFQNIKNNCKSTKIYKFDIVEPKYSNELKNIIESLDYNFINASTGQFLQFLQDNKSKIKNILITGAKIIDKNFIEEVKKVGTIRNFQPADFYLAKQTAECQWYGIIEDGEKKAWDVDRKIYPKLKAEVIKAFKDEYREPKIIARLLGRGGSGKSTLLRRLAVDLKEEDFDVVWVNDKEFTEFCDKGKNDFSNYPENKFLVIIEDWYRIKQSKKDNSADIINSLCNYNNVRIVIGDRTIDNSIAKGNLYTTDEDEFKLTVDENKKTIPKILYKISDWKRVADILLKNKSDFNSSLYLILFTIGRKFQELGRKSISTIDTKSIEGHFQDIVTSDLRAIAIHFPGYAKAIYYWAKVYATNKIYIGFDVFEKIAKEFNEQNDFTPYDLLPYETKSIVDIYINKSQSHIKSAKDLQLIAFNHDILAEDGLAKVEHQILGSTWHPFGDDIKIKLLDLIIAEGDAFSISSFIFYCLLTFEKVTKEQKLNYITAQYEKGNRGSYLNHLFYKNEIVNDKEKKEYARKFITEFIEHQEYFHSTISLSLHEVQNTLEGIPFATQLLERFKTEKLDHQIICNCLINLKDKKDKDGNEIGIPFATQLLEKFKTEKLSFEVICNCLINLKDKKDKDGNEIGIPFATQLLERFIEKKDVQHAIICNCLINLKDKKDKDGNEIGIPFATYILKNKDWKKDNWSIIYHSLGCFSHDSNLPEFVVKIVDAIIDENFKKNNRRKGSYFRYKNLMQIPFHQISSWENSNRMNINHWRNRPRNLITNTIRGNIDTPIAILKMCEDILQNWKTEIRMKILINKKDEIHFGDHIKLALGHPELKNIASKTAVEIVKAKEIKMVTIPDYLFEIAEKIVNKNIYPEWKLNDNDESDN
jgi:thymidylate kinase